MSTITAAAVIIITAAVILAVVAIIGYYLLAAFIVNKTGTTTGIADIGRAVAEILAATTRTPGGSHDSGADDGSKK